MINECLQIFRAELFGKQARIELYPAVEANQPVWRLIRLHHLIGQLSLLIPEALLDIAAMEDRNGTLMVFWHNRTSFHFQAAIATAWSGILCAERTDRVEHIINQPS